MIRHLTLPQLLALRSIVEDLVRARPDLTAVAKPLDRYAVSDLWATLERHDLHALLRALDLAISEARDA